MGAIMAIGFRRQRDSVDYLSKAPRWRYDGERGGAISDESPASDSDDEPPGILHDSDALASVKAGNGRRWAAAYQDWQRRPSRFLTILPLIFAMVQRRAGRNIGIGAS